MPDVTFNMRGATFFNSPVGNNNSQFSYVLTGDFKVKPILTDINHLLEDLSNDPKRAEEKRQLHNLHNLIADDKMADAIRFIKKEASALCSLVLTTLAGSALAEFIREVLAN